jgi:hypothetical protein
MPVKRLDGAQVRKLVRGLETAFPTYPALERAVRFGLDENLATISESKKLTDAAFQLVQWAEANGRVLALLDAALAENPNSAELRNLRDTLGDPPDRTIDSPDAGRIPTDAGPEDNHARLANRAPLLPEVRAAYRTIHAHHRRLFHMMARLVKAVERRFEPLPRSFWGSYLWDRVPREMDGFLEHWVFDFVPLQHAYFGWSQTKYPREGSFYIELCHSGDSALDDAPQGLEPDLASLAPPNQSNTGVSASVRLITPRSGGDVDVGTWGEIEDIVASEATWHDQAIHVASTKRSTIRYGGFRRDLEDLLSPEGEQRLLVAPLLALIDEARR